MSCVIPPAGPVAGVQAKEIETHVLQRRHDIGKPGVGLVARSAQVGNAIAA